MRNFMTNRSSNPVMRGNVFMQERAGQEDNAMTINGTINKTMILLAIVVGGVYLVWSNPAMFLPFMVPALILTIITSILTCFKVGWAPITAPMYAVCEGVVVGCLSLMFERRYPGIAVQAAGLTFGTLFSMLIVYKSRIIPITQNFIFMISSATMGICAFYFVGMISSMFGFPMPLISGSGGFSIGFSVVVVVIAALNLFRDFYYIEQTANYGGVDKKMEWYGAFSLMVTLIWLYIEFLHLLSKLRRD